MTKVRIIIFLFCVFSAVASGITRKVKFVIDERYVCAVKTSCLDCLRLTHCSWCPTASKCFSRELTEIKGFCPNNTMDHADFGLSFEQNAQCSCSLGEVEQRCHPPGVTTGPVCSGRGICICGQCVCNPVADPDQPTKMVMGEYCEFDNFSCEGPKCNEGPYSISDPIAVEDNPTKTTEVDIPADAVTTP